MSITFPTVRRKTTQRLEHKTTVAVLGLGYVGLPTAIALGSNGFRMLGIDVSESRRQAIAAGDVDLLDNERTRLRTQLAEERLLLSDDSMLSEADIVLVCVPTPVDENLQPDPRILKGACETIVEKARPGQTFVLTSTSYVGSTREMLVEPLARRGLEVGKEVFVCFSPERINPGVAQHTQATTPRVLSGYSDECCERGSVALSYTCLNLHRISSLEAAEMTKLYENTFRAVNIALAFEMADACVHYDLDPVEVTDAAASKPYGFMAHYPSAGVGGHCIGVDPYYLLAPLHARGEPAPMTDKALSLVSSRPQRVAERALGLLNGNARGARVLIVGASYKPGVADVREAPALKVITELGRAGARVSYFDPLIPTLEVAGRRYEHIAQPDPSDYDLTVIITIHPNVDYDWLHDCEEVLDCTYRTVAGHTHHLI